MELILTEHKIQQKNYEQMLQGQNVKKLSNFLDLVQNPKVIINCKNIFVAYLPADLFILPPHLLSKPYVKNKKDSFLDIPNQLKFKIANKYMNDCKKLYKVILKYKCDIKLATDDTLHGEFLGLYFIRKYDLESKLDGRLIPFAQTPSALRYAYGHPHKIDYHINYATAYYYKTFQKKLLKINLTRMFTMTMHKHKFHDLYPTYLSQYIILSKIQQATKLQRKAYNNWILKYSDMFGTTFQSHYSISSNKANVKKLTVALQQYPLRIEQQPRTRLYQVQPPKLLTTIEIIDLIKKYMNISSKDIIEKGLKPAYWKYHIISYPYTDNHLITMPQFNILKTNLGIYKHQLKELFDKDVPSSIFTYYAPRSRYVYKSKIKAQRNYQTALIPVRIVDKDEYQRMPQLIQLIEELVVTHSLLMFAQPAEIKKVQIKARVQGKLFISHNVIINKANWYQVFNYKPKEHQVNIKNYKTGQQIQGVYSFIPKKIKSYNKVIDFVRGNRNIKTIYDKTFERYHNILVMYRNHLIHIHKQTVTLTLNGKAELSMITRLNIKHSLMSNTISYNNYSRATNHLRRPYITAKNQGSKLLKETIQYLRNVFSAILTQNVKLPETPPAPEKRFLNQEILPINCPRCKKSYLLYQKYHIIKHSQVHERYICPSCGLILPTKLYSFPIHSSILPFIFHGMFAPAMFRVNGQMEKGRLIYKDGRIILSKVK